MALVLRRNLGPVRALVAGEWTKETASGQPALSCPDCGEIHEVEVGYMPKRPETKLRYIWSCPTPSCAFTQWVHLDALWEDVV